LGGTAFAPHWISFGNLFPRAAEPTEHLEVVFTPGCLTWPSPRLESPSLVRGENELCDPNCWSSALQFRVRMIVAWQCTVVASLAQTRRMLYQQIPPSLCCGLLQAQRHLLGPAEGALSVSQLCWQKAFALVLFIEKKLHFQ